MTKPLSVPGCLWIADHLLVRTRKAMKLALPQKLLKGASDAGVACVVSLLSKEEFLDAETDAPRGLVADALDTPFWPQEYPQPKVFTSHVFWPEADLLPTARQVRQALEIIEDAHTLGLRVLVNGVGHPARAAIVAGCWLAREGRTGDKARLGWLDQVGSGPRQIVPPLDLSPAQQAFVADWPTGREGQPELADLEYGDLDEVFPTALVSHWLKVLPSVRVYTTVRGRAVFKNVPVLNETRVSDGADIDLHAEELRCGVWIGERTLRLSNGWEVVFTAPRR